MMIVNNLKAIQSKCLCKITVAVFRCCCYCVLLKRLLLGAKGQPELAWQTI